jgi:hypothetical protein
VLPGRLRPNPRVTASVAILVALTAITLEIVYAVGRFALETFEQIPTP